MIRLQIHPDFYVYIAFLAVVALAYGMWKITALIIKPMVVEMVKDFRKSRKSRKLHVVGDGR